jgi:hypothetical protein
MGMIFIPSVFAEILPPNSSVFSSSFLLLRKTCHCVQSTVTLQQKLRSINSCSPSVLGWAGRKEGHNNMEYYMECVFDLGFNFLVLCSVICFGGRLEGLMPTLCTAFGVVTSEQLQM